MEHFKTLAAGLTLLIALIAVAQTGDDVTFSVSSDRTFSPGESPRVQLWGQGVSALEFRVYRISNPTVFFEKLKDDHNFGGRSPRPEREQTPLERFRSWKFRQRSSIRNFVRAQFTRDARVQYTEWRTARTQPVRTTKTVAEFANVPVLNPQQLVATWKQPLSSDRSYESSAVPIPVADKGLYLVEATNGRLSAYTIVSVSDLGMISKGAPGRLLVRTVNRRSGEPIKSVPITVLGPHTNNTRERCGSGSTDSNGLAEIPIPQSKIESLLILARTNNDFAVVSSYGGNVASTEDQSLEGYVYTDRPVYRPGHNVNYRAILRSRQPQGYQLPKGREASIEVQDSEGKTVYRTQQSLSALGTLNGQFPLPAAASLGFYSVQVKMGDSYHAGGFQVEEYKKPEYEVRVTPTQKRVISGSQVEAEIYARYFYGEPVAGAKVKWVIHRSRYYLPYYLDDEDDIPGGDADSPYLPQEQIEEHAGTLNAEGKLTVKFNTAEAQQDQRYRLEARVTDAAGREIAGSGSTIATTGSYFVHLNADQYFYAPGQQANFTVEARDYDNRPITGAAFTVELLEWNWKSNTGTVIAKSQGTTGSDGNGRAALPVKSGSLRAHVTSRTPEGRTVEDYEYIWVSGDASWMRSGMDQRIQIVPDKKGYRAGDTAKVLIFAGEPGTHLWVTLEGRSVFRSHFIAAADGTASIDVPITSAYAPNIFLTAVALRGGRLLQGAKSLKVPPVEQTLLVDVKPSKPEFKPGEKAAYTIEAKDSSGRPAVNAEFSVSVVDEAIYAVRPDSAPDIVKAFYGREWNRVNTDSSLSYFFHGEAGTGRMNLATLPMEAQRARLRAQAQLKPERMVQPKVRRAFPDTAFWSAAVKTDSAGRAQVSLEFPDALTEWRATARGITADTKVGSALNRVTVRKNLLTRLAVPRFFRQGDTITVSVITQNFLPAEKKVRVSLEAQGLELLNATSADVSIPSKGTNTLDIKVKVPGGASAKLLAKALSDEESDALELTLPILPYGVKMAEVRGGSFTGSTTEAVTQIQFPADAEPGTRTLDLSVSPSAAGSVFEALDYLTSFPYGCTEQTMSSFLPNIIVSQATKTLDIKVSVDEAALTKKIRAGLDRLYDYQHEDGGWGWWKTDETDTFMTAYVVAGLAQARTAGHSIDDERLSKAVTHLQSRDLSKASTDLQTYVTYALALNSAPATRQDGLWNQRNTLSPYALALLGLALEQRKDSRAAELATLLESRARQTDLEAWWESKRDPLLDIEIDASPEATAYAVKLLSHLKPQSPLLPKAALYLANHRTGGYFWTSTKQTAMVIFGLTDYLKSSGELKPDFSVTVTVNDKPALTKRFTAAEALAPATMHIPIVDPTSRIRVTRVGAGRVYWSARGEYYSSQSRLANRANLRLNLDREYFKLTPAKQGEKIVYEMNPLRGPVVQGDVIAVHLTLTGGDWRYLLLEDPIPSGAEIIENDNLYELTKKPDWWQYFFTRREFRDDRAAFFQTYFNNKQEHFYLLKIVNPGEFRISPARVEPMYQPQYFATSDSARLEVTR